VDYDRLKKGQVDPALADVLDKIRALTPTLIETRCGVSHTTIRNWRNGKVRRPQNATMEFALRAAGYKRIIVPRDE